MVKYKGHMSHQFRGLVQHIICLLPCHMGPIMVRNIIYMSIMSVTSGLSFRRDCNYTPPAIIIVIGVNHRLTDMSTYLIKCVRLIRKQLSVLVDVKKVGGCVQHIICLHITVGGCVFGWVVCVCFACMGCVWGAAMHQ